MEFVELQAKQHNQRAYGVKVEREREGTIKIKDFDDEIPQSSTIEIDGDRYLIIIVSDAFYHIERLAFLGKESSSPGEYIMASGAQLAGDMTLMIAGGDSESIKPDTYYLEDISNRVTY